MTSAPVPDWLLDAPMTVEGALTEASNLTLLVHFDLDEHTEGHDGERTGGRDGQGVPDESDLPARRGVYKPVRGERPLYDFPTGTLAQREVTAYLVSEWGGWHLVPPTVLRDGPLGPGSVQQWVEAPEQDERPGTGLVDVLRPEHLGEGWLPVLQAQDRYGSPLLVAHADDPDLAGMAVLDAVLNNADRKAAHLTRDGCGRLWGFDHGLCAHARPKLRTVLWGWAGQPLPEREVQRLTQLMDAITAPARHEEVGSLLSLVERHALLIRIQGLLTDAVFPDPPQDRSALPWPLW